MTATTGDPPTLQSVGALARQQYRRARNAGTDFVDLAIAVRNLYSAFNHLDAEARDPDSPLHHPTPPTSSNIETQDSVYARQVRSLIEDSDFALKQANTVLERYAGSSSPSGSREPRVGTTRTGSDLAERARRTDLIRGDVISQTLKIELFLDTVQLHHPTMTQPAPQNVDDEQMDAIKNKVDAVAARVFRERRTQSPIDIDEEELWQSFRSELEREGFSSEVLRRNKACPLPPSTEPDHNHGMTNLGITGGTTCIYPRTRVSPTRRRRNTSIGSRPAGVGISSANDRHVCAVPNR